MKRILTSPRQFRVLALLAAAALAVGLLMLVQILHGFYVGHHIIVDSSQQERRSLVT